MSFFQRNYSLSSLYSLPSSSVGQEYPISFFDPHFLLLLASFYRDRMWKPALETFKDLQEHLKVLFEDCVHFFQAMEKMVQLHEILLGEGERLPVSKGENGPSEKKTENLSCSYWVQRMKRVVQAYEQHEHQWQSQASKESPLTTYLQAGSLEASSPASKVSLLDAFHQEETEVIGNAMNKCLVVLDWTCKLLQKR